MTATPASKRILRRLDDLQASLGDVMTRINRLEEAVRTVLDDYTFRDMAIAGLTIRVEELEQSAAVKSLAKRIEALERSDG